MSKDAKNGIEKIQNPSVDIEIKKVREDNRMITEPTEHKKKQQEYIYEKVTEEHKIREKLKDIRITAQCIIEATYDAEFILDNGESSPDFDKNKITHRVFQDVSNYCKKITYIERHGIPFFRDYEVEREYDYK